MNTITHAEMVTALVKSPGEIWANMDTHSTDMMHAVLGIAGESGELVDAVKKVVVYQKPVDRTNIVEELGDMEFYLEQLRQALGITREETLKANMEKLAVRYKNYQYSDEQAIERNDKASDRTK